MAVKDIAVHTGSSLNRKSLCVHSGYICIDATAMLGFPQEVIRLHDCTCVYCSLGSREVK